MKYTAIVNGKTYEVEIERVSTGRSIGHAAAPAYAAAPASAPAAAPTPVPAAAPAAAGADTGALCAPVNFPTIFAMAIVANARTISTVNTTVSPVREISRLSPNDIASILCFISLSICDFPVSCPNTSRRRYDQSAFCMYRIHCILLICKIKKLSKSISKCL